ncbi:gustatory and pheromone receptor 32a-like [Anastrepha ludens]|uniref:gustatory and pheromone receptor 32a-like n=1 Tax=Anastrepha ludens TaxID=28586 RepID=UPI0023AFC577|nr:gustatory and pheromone receptor 32a-like [Anastrepha ludens]
MQNRHRIFYSISENFKESSQQHTNPILAYLKWHLLLLKYIGVIPFYTTLNMHEIGAPTRRWLLITRAIVCIKVLLNLLHVYAIFSASILQMLFLKSKTDGINNILDVTFCMLSNITISWTCACNATQIIAIINRLLKVDELLKRYPDSPAQKSYNKNLYNTYLILAFSYIFVIMMAYVKRTVDVLSFYFCLYVAFYQLENAASCAFTIFISSLMHLLAERFQYINQMLSQYDSKILHKSEYSSTSIKLAINSKGEGNMQSEANLRLFAQNSKMIYSLHNDLLDIYKMINSYAGLGLLAFLLYAFYGLLSSTYGCFLYHWQNKFHWKYILFTVSWIPLYTGVLILLTSNCEIATKEANKTAQILSRIYGKGQEYQSVIDKFLTKSIKQEVHFTAYGFFTIDKTTLFKIFSAVTTYLVLLIQFRQLEESKSSN